MQVASLILAIAALAGVAYLLTLDPASPGADSGNQDALADLTERVDALREKLSAESDAEEELAALRERVALLEAQEDDAPASAGDATSAAQPKPVARKGPAAPNQVDTWLKRLEDDDEDIVFSATIELARLGDPRASAPLTRVLQSHRDFYARLGAATALGELKAAPSVPALIDALGDKDDLVRTAAAEALHLITSQDFDFVSGLDAAKRSAIQLKWRAWWQENEAAVVERIAKTR